MNIWKKALALITAALIVLRVLMCDAYAIAGPTIIAADELTVYLTELLMGAGHSSSELDGLGNDDLQNLLQSDIDNGNINPSTFNTSSLSGGQTGGNIFSDAFTKIWNQAQQDGADLYDFIHPTKVSAVSDVPEGGCVLYKYNRDGSYSVYYCSVPGEVWYANGDRMVYIPSYHVCEYTKNGVMWGEKDSDISVSMTVYSTDLLYGSWTMRSDGTPAETDDEYEYYVGEADGVPVTPDMVSSDGTVTIDGTTYTPDEYVDPDALTDEAIIELLKEILKVIDNTPVVDTSDNTIADDIAGEVEVELDEAAFDSFLLNTSIANVFPFCLPFDFIRGVQLFAAEPETPHFEFEINTPSFLGIPEQHWAFEIDLSEFETLAKITRWLSYLSFVFVLIQLTGKIVKGAGA